MPMIGGRDYADSYDSAFVGSSTISLLEALHQHRLGRRVLLVDDQPRIGGVWVTLDLFGLHDVENAIHYFLYDAAGIAFMRSVLGWDVIQSPRKFRIFPTPVLGRSRIPFDSRVGLIATRIREARAAGDRSSFVTLLVRAAKDAIQRRGTSHYLAGGTPDMIRKVEQLVRGVPLDLLLDTTIEHVHFDRPASRVRIKTSRGEFTADRIFITHGARLRHVTSDDGHVEMERLVLRRPQVHLLVRDSLPTEVYEGIFVADDLIKYVHDVTRFTREASELHGNRKLFVVALRHDCELRDELFTDVLSKLKDTGLVGANAELEGTHWYESFLPELSTTTLDRLKKDMDPLVEAMSSENFCAAIAMNADRWRASLQCNKLPAPYLMTQIRP
jgi:hypothetical protein